MNNSRVEKIVFLSKVLDKEMPMLVYLPGSYNNFTPLPVLYFFHGRSGNENIMYNAEVNTIADRMINKGEIKPLIIVCPFIENSRGINSSIACKEESSIGTDTIINIGMYEDYFIKEIIPLTDNSFNTIKDRTGRYLGGASGGGYAALHNSFRHQDLFTKVGGHMPAIELKLEDEDKPFFNNMDTWYKYDPVYIAQNNSISLDIEVYLDAGDLDEGRFYEGCAILHNILKEKGIKSYNHLFPGHHNSEYIKSNMEKYLKFYGCQKIL